MISDRTRTSLEREIRSNTVATIGVALLLSMLLMAVFAPVLAPHDPTDQDSSRNHQPPLFFGGEESETTRMIDGEIRTVTESNAGTLAHPLGTDSNGRDVLSRTIYGARTSIIVAFSAMAVSLVVGTTVGMVSGYYAGRTDSVLMRFVDIVLAFPALLITLAMIGILGNITVTVPDPLVASGLVSDRPTHAVIPVTITLAISSVVWVWIARVARGEAIAAKNEEYVMAARTMGMSNLGIIRKHVLPNSITPILVLATIQVASIIIIESSLSFLGFSGTTLSWGYDIAAGRDYLATSWWLSTVPGLFIVVTVVGINLLGDLLRDALDPGIQRGGL
ncbi:ABC transporter permease [Natronobiforma cellulositropha]|uniref:ABC transporter permease n=1 Tax=Natronobiforma cellulositropha TaxID=1679076 RepID=UPI0021D61541|nr:ABC transporter permease [Natronobiforma cellulositropha]